MKTGYCVLCAGEFPLDKLHVISRYVDPYIQLEDESVHACDPCYERDYGKFEPEPKLSDDEIMPGMRDWARKHGL